MAVPSSLGIKHVYREHLELDQNIQPIDLAGAGQLRTTFVENMLGHTSGANLSPAQGVLAARYSTFTKTPQKDNWKGEVNRGNPNHY